MEIICTAGSNWKGSDCKAEYRSMKIPKDDRASNLFYSSKMIFSVNESSEISFHSERFIDLGKYKGQKKVIRAMAELAKEGIQFEYHLAGTGDQSELKKYAEKYALSDKVIFHGGIPHEQVPGFLDEVDIYIQPSDQEGLPRALVEAMSRACPAIGSRVGGIPELLSEDMIFSPKDINGLCACLKKMTLKRMKEEARRNYERAKDFDKNFLDRRRTAFINEFLKDSGLINN